MAGLSRLRNFQIADGAITRNLLSPNLLNGADLDLTGGAMDATITGLRDGTANSDAATVGQLNAALAGLSNGVILRGELAAGSDLTGNATGNTYADGADGFSNGDLFCITGDGVITVSDGALSVNNGDKVYIKQDVAADSAITLADLFKQDNSESPDLLREGGVVDNLTSMDAVAPLSANQGNILNTRLAAIEAMGIEICGEQPAVVAGTNTVTIANTPIAGTLKVFRNGLRLCEGVLPNADYSVVGTTVTFDSAFETDEVVILDYRRV